MKLIMKWLNFVAYLWFSYFHRIASPRATPPHDKPDWLPRALPNNRSCTCRACACVCVCVVIHFNENVLCLGRVSVTVNPLHNMPNTFGTWCSGIDFGLALNFMHLLGQSEGPAPLVAACKMYSHKYNKNGAKQHFNAIPLPTSTHTHTQTQCKRIHIVSLWC